MSDILKCAYELINNGLFPIVACVAVAWYFNKVNDSYRGDIKELNRQQVKSMDAVTKAINDNTLVIQQLLDKEEKEDESNN